MFGEKLQRDADQELAGDVQFQCVTRVEPGNQFVQFMGRGSGDGAVLLLQRFRRVVLAKRPWHGCLNLGVFLRDELICPNTGRFRMHH